MKCISVRPIWAWLIAHGYKDVENRTWPTKHRGPILIHASAALRAADYKSALAAIDSSGLHIPVPVLTELPRAGIVGVASLIDCVLSSSSPWFVGTHGFLLKAQRPVPFCPIKGRLGLFDVDLCSLPHATTSAIKEWDGLWM